MEFDKGKVYTAVNADDLKVGSKVIAADQLGDLKQRVLRNEQPKELLEVLDENHTYRFHVLNEEVSTLAYLVSEPEEKNLKWTDLKLGDVITRDKLKYMVTAIDSADTACHIFAGDIWLNDVELEQWEKANENNN